MRAVLLALNQTDATGERCLPSSAVYSPNSTFREVLLIPGTFSLLEPFPTPLFVNAHTVLFPIFLNKAFILTIARLS